MHPVKISPTHIFFCLILLLGIFARVWGFGSLPPGLNQDEASSGVDAYYLLHYGMDRNGESWPVHAIAFGSGQNVPYDYLTIPFIAVGGLTPLTVRFPMLLTGILSLPLVFYMGRKIAGNSFGLVAMLFIAVSPWHILLSRWGLDSNILPFLFLTGFICLLKSTHENQWFVLSGLFMGLSLYAYGTAYTAVPLIMVLASLILMLSKKLNVKTLVLGWAVLILISLPIDLFVLINTFKLQTLNLGILTIPRLPSDPRFELMAAIFKPHFLSLIKNNALNTLSMLWFHSDRQIWNGLDPYGYFYPFTLPLAFLGILGLLPLRGVKNKAEKLLLLAWLIACIPACVLQIVNFNRINILFIPLIICMGIPLLWLKGRFLIFSRILIAFLLVGFIFFFHDLTGSQYRKNAGDAFAEGLLPAIDSARQTPNVPICITGKVNMPYIDTLFVEQPPLNEFISTVKYNDPTAPFRVVLSFGRYTFNLKDCPNDPATIFVLVNNKEFPPNDGIQYHTEQFANFTVYRPK